MALFKILKGSSANLSSQKIREGYCYVTTDEGKMYIDVSDTKRICLNAGDSPHADKADTADKLTYKRLINGVEFDGSSDIYFYGTCSTAASTVAKTVTLQNGSTFVLKTGATVIVKFTNKNSASSPTLNINGTGAKPIYRYGTTAASTSDGTSGWRAGSVHMFTYDGTGWIRHFWENTNTIPSGYCTTAADTAAKTASCTDYALKTNSYLQLIIKTANTSKTALTLNVNGKGAKPIYINGAASSKSNYTLPAGSYITFYDGTNYYIRTDGKLPGTIEKADKANNLNNLSIGTNQRPVYFNGGVPTQTTYRMAGTNAAATTALSIASDLPTGIWYVNGTNTDGQKVSDFNQADGVVIANQYSDKWITEIYQDYRTGQLAVRGKNNGTWQAWRKVLDDTNYTSYTVKKDGTGASGTWGISISGKAATATNATNANYATTAGSAGSAGKLSESVSVGGATKPVYFSKGTPTACTTPASGAYFSSLPVIGSDGVVEIGRYIDFHYTNNSTNDYDVRIDSAGAKKNTIYLPGVTGQVVVHTNDTKIGGSDTPVYIAATGAATAASKYAGGTQVTLNGTSKSASTAAFYAPTAAGTAGQVLKSAGSGKAPVWANISDLMDGRFVNASGDTMTGNLTLTGEKATIYKVERKKASGGGWAYAPMRFIGNDNAVFANIGAYGGDNALTYMYIGVGDYNSDINLRISATGAVTAKSFVGPLTGNATSATTATKDSSGAVIKNTYVKKAGDTMSGALNTSYQSSTWINSANGKSAINLTGTGYTGWISGNAKDGKLVISSYPSNNNLLYFGYMSNGRIAAGTNSLEQSMTWDGSTNTLTATTFKGALDGNAKTATNATNATNAGHATTAGSAGSATTATTANQLAQNTRMDYGWSGLNYFNISGTAGNAAKKNDTPTNAWWHILRFNHANSSGYYTDLAVPFNANSLYYKRITSGAVQNNGWVKVLDALNYNDYAPKLNGTGAKGTWGISITGNAATATNAGHATSAGSAGSAGKLTDINENDKASSSDTWRRLWFSYNNNTTGRPAYDDRFAIQTSTGTLKAPIFSGNLSGNASSATLLKAGAALTSETADSVLESTASLKINTANNTVYNTNDGLILTASWSASYGAQIWLDDGSGEGGMAIRNRNANGWNPWRQVITSANIGSQSVSHATTAGSAGSAGTATTATTATKARLTEVILNDSSNWKLGVQWRNTTLEAGAYLAGIGRHNTGGNSTNPGTISIVPYATDTSPWGGTVGLFISKDDIKFENHTIIHSGNHSSYDKYNTPKYTSGLQIGTGTNVASLYVPNATSSQSGVVTTGAQTFAGTKTFSGQVVISNTTDAAKGSASGAFRIGAISGEHLAMDGNEIMAKSNATTASTLYLNSEGGNVQIGGPTSIISTLSVSSTGTFSGEVRSTSANAFRMVQGNYGVFLRNDGSDTYFLITASGDQYGNWNGLRPFYFNNTSGNVTMGHNLSVGGTIYGNLSGNATTSYYPYGFTSYNTNATWGNQTGTTVVCWNEANGGSVDWRRDNPSSEKISLKVDGRFYGNEGSKPAMLMTSANGYWGLSDPDGTDSVWIRTTTQGIIPYQSGGRGSGHQSLGTSSWYFSQAYIDTVQTSTVYATNWFRSYNETGWYNESYKCHVMPFTGTYGGVRITGNSRGGYDGLIIGDSSGITLMSSTDRAHHGLYHQDNEQWAFYYNKGNKQVSILGAQISATGFPLTIYGATYMDGRLVVKGNGSSYNEGIRVLPASNGWSNIFFSANTSTEGTMDGGWLVGRRGAAGGTYGAAGDFCIENNNSSGVNLTLTKSGILCNIGPIFGYRYKQTNNGAAFMWDKPGSHYTGVGANGSSNTIQFGPCDASGNWVSNFHQHWRFVGSMSADSVISTPVVTGGMWIEGSHEGAFRVTSATNASAGGYYQAWFSGKTPNGAWGMGPLAGSNDLYFVYGSDANYNAGTNDTRSVRFSSDGKVWGAVWNDYAEFRTCVTTFEAGQVVCENGDDTLSLSTERLQPGACIVSDTFGFAIGETDIADCPIAVSGRVLAYPYEDRNSYKAGDPVCAGPNGTVSKMTREEVREYPDRMIGTVSAIPKYETWGQENIPVNGRIWIKVV